MFLMPDSPLCGICGFVLVQDDKLAYLFTCNNCADVALDESKKANVLNLVTTQANMSDPSNTDPSVCRKMFKAGYIACLKMYAVWKDGEQFVGIRAHKLHDVIDGLDSDPHFEAAFQVALD